MMLSADLRCDTVRERGRRESMEVGEDESDRRLSGDKEGRRWGRGAHSDVDRGGRDDRGGQKLRLAGEKKNTEGDFKKERKHVRSKWKSAEGGMGEGEKKNQDDKEAQEWGDAADSLITVFSQTIQPRCHLFLMTTLCALVCVKIVWLHTPLLFSLCILWEVCKYVYACVFSSPELFKHLVLAPSAGVQHYNTAIFYTAIKTRSQIYTDDKCNINIILKACESDATQTKL